MPGNEDRVETLFAHDPVKYRELSEPFKNTEEADAAVLAFTKELRELRAKHKITDLYVIVRASVKISDTPGDEGVFMLTAHNGDEIYAEPMVAYAFGHEQNRRQERIARMASGKSLKTNRGTIGK